MPNKANAKEWLQKAWHDLSLARVLFDAFHFTDSIAADLQQAIEKILKSFLAYQNKPIKKTHNLLELSVSVAKYIQFDEKETEILGMATLYYIHDRYPAFQNLMPSREQIGKVLDFADNLFHKACSILEIDEKEVMQ